MLTRLFNPETEVGLNGDLDRLPLLTWIMFLKFLDDLEIKRVQEAQQTGKKFKTAIEKPYHRGRAAFLHCSAR